MPIEGKFRVGSDSGEPPLFHRLEELEPLAPRMSPTGLARLAGVAVTVSLLALVLAGGIALRTIALGNVPAGFNQDEACNGYDAWCLLHTGRDQHGNRFPVLIQAFNDYRMPLFDYSLIVPLAVFGLHPATVRLGAALWGIADLIAMAVLATELVGLRGAVIAVFLMAVSPWHLPLSRFGVEAITASATVTIATACALTALRRRHGRWLLGAGLFFGAALYSYAIAKAFVPLMIVWLAIIYWRELRPVRRHAVAGLISVVVCAIPQALLLLGHSGATMARFEQISAVHGLSWSAAVRQVGWGWLSNFAPGYLFLRGSADLQLHPPGFGQLLTIQSAMVFLALCALASASYRRLAVFLLGWLALAAIPAALIRPPHHPLHGVLMIAPWTLLSALGMVFLFDFAQLASTIRIAMATVILLVALAEGISFSTFYFTRYPAIAAASFQDGLAAAIKFIASERHGYPVVLSGRINQPYIYVLFFDRYPPRRFQGERKWQGHGLFSPVMHFDRYIVGNPAWEYRLMPHGIFLFTAGEPLPAPPSFIAHRRGGAPAYAVIVK